MAIVGEKQMLFSLNGIDFASNYGKLENALRFYKGTMQTMAHWSDTDGGGRFTILISRYFIYQLKKWMMETGEGGTLALNHPPYHSKYEKFKDKYGKFGDKPWMLLGGVYDNVDVIYRGKHTQTVGIKRSIMAKRKYGTPISIAKYAAINEFGGRFHPPRPLFQPAMLKFVSQHFPPMVKALKKAIYNSAKEHGKSQAVTSEGVGEASDVISEASLTGMVKVSKANVNRDFNNDMFSEDLNVGGGIGGGTKALNKSGKIINKAVTREMIKMAKGMGMTVAELERFLSEGD